MVHKMSSGKHKNLELYSAAKVPKIALLLAGVALLFIIIITFKRFQDLSIFNINWNNRISVENI